MHGKRYRKAAENIDHKTFYPIPDAIRMVKEGATAKFDETIEVHLKLGVDVRHADQQVRGTIMLPHGTGKSMRVAVFAQGDKAREAEEAGADVVGAQDLADKVGGGYLEFDAAISTPDLMNVVGKLGKVLGPRGLMPNPKTGTVTFDVGKAVRDIKAGKVEYRTDKFGIIHVPIGKASFTHENLADNYLALIEEVLRAKPSSSKGRYLRSVAVTSTMGPSVKIDPQKAKESEA